MRNIMLLTLICFGLSACGARRVSLPDALHTLNQELIDSNILSPDDIENDAGRTQFIAAIKSTQTEYCQSNPTVMMLLKDFTLSLEGAFTTSGTLSVSGAASGPMGGMSFNMSSEQIQTLALPITITSLSNMPEIYQNYLFNNLQNVSVTQDQMNEIDTRISNLKTLVADQINSFQSDPTSNSCKNRENNIKRYGFSTFRSVQPK